MVVSLRLCTAEISFSTADTANEQDSPSEMADFTTTLQVVTKELLQINTI